MNTLVVFESKILGLSPEPLAVGEVVELELTPGSMTTLVVVEVLDKPSKIGLQTDERDDSSVTDVDADDVLANTVDYEKVAYLVINKRATRDYKKKTSQRLEKRMAKSLGGNITPGSGAFSGHKGDVRAATWLGEHKYTDATFYRLKRDIWAKISTEAFEVRRTPILEIVIDQSKKPIRLMFVELNDFYYRTNADEETFGNIFSIKQYLVPKGSANLKASEVQSHIDEVYRAPGSKLPGFFITFHEKLTLFGMLGSDFEKVFESD